jgi:hypothetical protein
MTHLLPKTRFYPAFLTHSTAKVVAQIDMGGQLNEFLGCRFYFLGSVLMLAPRLLKNSSRREHQTGKMCFKTPDLQNNM